MRTGRPRKQNADRFPCGKLKPSTAEQIAKAQRAQEEAEMKTVLAQPHRRGNRSQLMESPFGRFCVYYDIQRELYDAGEAYASLRRQYQAAVNAPMPDRLGGSGGDLETEQLRKWHDLLKAWEAVMLNAGGYHGRLSIISLTMNWPGLQARVYVTEAKAALTALAVYQGRLERR